MYRDQFYKIILFAIISAFLTLGLHSCASTGFSAGEQKNSLPFMGKELLEDIHTIAVPDFYGNRDSWRETTHEIMSSVKRISVISPSKVDNAVKNSRKDLSVLDTDERFDFMGRLGRTLHADAVINGLVISKDNHNEIILQLISSKDSKILWWQAVEFRGETPSPSDQKDLLTRMLSPLLAHIGRSEKPASVSAPQQQPKSEQEPKADTQPKSGTKPKSDKRPDKTPKPSSTPDDIGPM